MHSCLLLSVLAAALAACLGVDGPVGETGTEKEMTFAVRADDSVGEWKEGDAIAILDKKGVHRFTAMSAGAEASFKGECHPLSLTRVAVYPYDESLQVFRGGELGVSIPHEQFKGDPVCVSHSGKNSFVMRPAGSSISFRLRSPGVVSATVEGVRPVPLCGEAQLTFDDKDGSFSRSGPESGSGISLVPAAGKAVLDTGMCRVSCWPAAFPDGVRVTLKYQSGLEVFFDYPSPEALSVGENLFLGEVGKEDDYGPEVKKEDDIPDFSRVGYHYGEREIPDIPVRTTLEAPKDGSDARSMIQKALDAVPAPGAVLLKAGTYNVSDGLLIKRSGVVLRGEGESTVIYCTATGQIPYVIQMGEATSKALGGCSEIIAKYVPVGQLWVPVKDPGMFTVGETVFVWREATEEWLDAIRMRQIPQNEENNVEQWTTGKYSIYWQRKIVAIEGNILHLDNPIVMGIGSPAGQKWGGGRVYKGSWQRISECGIENLVVDTRFDGTKKDGGDFVDEDHAWTGIAVRCAENCWVRNVTTRHMGYCSIHLSTGSHLVTVRDCESLSPVSQVTGSRRYAFTFSGAEACLFTRCHCDDDRHQFVCGQRVPGPNVFHRCVCTNARNEAGPHQRWATGTLFDNVVTDGSLRLHDRCNYGTGHGWTCANTVLYNCTAASIVCQSPWASAQNWAIGCVGTRKAASRSSYPDGLTRPDGIWVSEGVHVSPESLYESQFSERIAKGICLDH
jgi:hypothetical protein